MTELLYSPKIKPEHLARKAIVYLRQSSDKQVQQNKESQRYYWLLLAEGHLNRRLFSRMLRRIWALPVPGGSDHPLRVRNLVVEGGGSEGCLRNRLESNRSASSSGRNSPR